MNNPINEADFDVALATFVEGCQKINDAHFAANYESLRPDAITFTRGKRYIKVIMTNDAGDGQRSVHCFVDTTNGDVLKAAGWSAPAKHARGNLFDEHNGLGRMGPYGPAYLR